MKMNEEIKVALLPYTCTCVSRKCYQYHNVKFSLSDICLVLATR